MCLPVSHALTVQAVGDVMLGSNFPGEYYFPQGMNAYLHGALNIFRTPGTFNLINLEGTLGGGDADAKDCGASALKSCFVFRMPPQTADILKEANIHVANMANNHSNDFGSNGRAATLKELQRVGVQAVGQSSAAFADTPSQRVRVIGCSFHVGSLHCTHDQARIEGLIEEGKSNGLRVIMSAHWGAEGMKHAHVTRKDEVYLGGARGNPWKLAHRWVDLGADLVIGHGPHIPRAMELYKGRLIAYSLGNFATFGAFNVREWNGLAPLLQVELEDNGQLRAGRIYSFRQSKQVPLTLDPDNRAFQVIRQLTQEDFAGGGLNFNEDGQKFLPAR